MPQVYLALSVLALLAVQTYQFSGVPSAHFGTFDFLELENTAYEVEITSTPVTELQIQEKEVRMCVWWSAREINWPVNVYDPSYDM